MALWSIARAIFGAASDFLPALREASMLPAKFGAQSREGLELAFGIAGEAHDHVVGAGIGEPAVERPRRALEGRADRPGEPDRRTARTIRRRAERAALDPPAPVPIDGLPGPQGAGEAQPLHHPADPPFERHARRDKFRP